MVTCQPSWLNRPGRIPLHELEGGRLSNLQHTRDWIAHRRAETARRRAADRPPTARRRAADRPPIAHHRANRPPTARRRADRPPTARRRADRPPTARRRADRNGTTPPPPHQIRTFDVGMIHQRAMVITPTEVLLTVLRHASLPRPSPMIEAKARLAPRSAWRLVTQWGS
jgi:hypothetical protein